MSWKSKRSVLAEVDLRVVAMYAAIFFIIAAMDFPIVWMFILSVVKWFRPGMSFIPRISDLTLAHYGYILHETYFIHWFWNSTRVALITTSFVIVVASLGGYGLSRFRFRGRHIFGVSLLFSQMIPLVALIIPLFVLLSKLHLTNKAVGLALTYLVFALPFSVWMLWGYFDSVPVELEEAAMVDGASRIQSLYKIVLPLAAPGIGAVAIFTFVLCWHDFLIALTLMSADTKVTLPVGAFRFTGESSRIVWGDMMALGVMTTIPVIVFFVFMQRYLVRGLTAGAVKG